MKRIYLLMSSVILLWTGISFSQTVEKAERYANYEFVCMPNNSDIGPYQDIYGFEHSINPEGHIEYGLLEDLAAMEKLRCNFIPTHSYKGVAYLWGGYATRDEFDIDIDLGEGIGAYAENAFYWYGWEYAPIDFATGIDCSGFVSKMWGLGPKQGTSGLNSGDTILNSVILN